MYTIYFYDVNGNLIVDIFDFGLIIDFDTLKFTTIFDEGEGRLTFNAFVGQNFSIVKRAFYSSIYKVELKDSSGTTLWVGRKSSEYPTYNADKQQLSVTFIGFFVLLKDMKLGKRWIENEVADNLDTPLARKENSEQLRGTIEPDGLNATFRMLSKDAELFHGVAYHYKQYTDKNNHALKSFALKMLARSGEGVGFEFWNEVANNLLLKVDATDTGDQKIQVGYVIPTTTITGIDTPTLGIRMIASDEFATNLFYGDGIETFAGTLNFIGLSENTFVLPFNKSFINKLINSVTVKLSSNSSLSAAAAIYDDSFNKKGDFDNTVVIPISGTLNPYTFTKSGGMVVGNDASANLLYYLVIRFNNVGNEVLGLTGRNVVTNPPSTTFVTNGYKGCASLAGAFPSRPASITMSSTAPSQWVKLEFELIQGTQSEYDQNDRASMINPVIKLKFNPLHSAYGAEFYNGPNLIEDTLLEGTNDVVKFDAELIPSGINNDNEFEETIGSHEPKSIIEVLQSFYKVYNLGELYPAVWAYNNDGIPRFYLREREVFTNQEYLVINAGPDSRNVDVDIRNTSERINFVHVTYTVDDIDMVADGYQYPQLIDLDNWLLVPKHYHYVDKEINLSGALQIGEGIINESKKSYPTGTVTITGDDSIRDFNNDIFIPADRIKAGQLVLLNNYIDELGNINPVLQVMRTEYDVKTQKLKLVFDLNTKLGNYLSNLKKFNNNNK